MSRWLMVLLPVALVACTPQGASTGTGGDDKSAEKGAEKGADPAKEGATAAADDPKGETPPGDEKATAAPGDPQAELVARLTGDWHIDLKSLDNDPALKGLNPQQELQAKAMIAQQMADVRFTFAEGGRIRLGFGPAGRVGTYVVDKVEGTSLHITTTTGTGDDQRVEKAILRIEGDAMWVTEGQDNRTIRLLRGPPPATLPPDQRRNPQHPAMPNGAMPPIPNSQPTSMPAAGSQPTRLRAPGSQPTSRPAGHAPGARRPPGHPGAGARALPPGHPPAKPRPASRPRPRPVSPRPPRRSDRRAAGPRPACPPPGDAVGRDRRRGGVRGGAGLLRVARHPLLSP